MNPWAYVCVWDYRGIIVSVVVTVGRCFQPTVGLNSYPEDSATALQVSFTFSKRAVLVMLKWVASPAPIGKKATELCSRARTRARARARVVSAEHMVAGETTGRREFNDYNNVQKWQC